jgi:SPP1 family predicted phage head-tail adaptor
MNLGQLDRQITLEFKTAGKSASGEPTEAWGGAVVVFANRLPMSGREYFSAVGAQKVAEEMITYKIRFRADVRPGVARIQDGGRMYQIRHVVELGRQVGLELMAETVTA